MQIVDRWRVILTFNLSDKQITFIISDNHYTNMLRKLAEVDYDLMPNKIEISRLPENMTSTNK